MIDAIAAVADDDAEFDDVARAVEGGEPDDIGIADVQRRPAWSALEAAFPGYEGLISGLELGVGGLALALASVGLVPVASCRSHPAGSWSNAPVVLFATDMPRAKILQGPVAEHYCGFDYDRNHPEFLMIIGRDIRSLNVLAAAVVHAAKEFGPRTIVKSGRAGKAGEEVAPIDFNQPFLPQHGSAWVPVLLDGPPEARGPRPEARGPRPAGRGSRVRSWSGNRSGLG